MKRLNDLTLDQKKQWQDFCWKYDYDSQSHTTRLQMWFDFINGLNEEVK